MQVGIIKKDSPLNLGSLSESQAREQLAVQVIAVGQLVDDLSKEAHAKQYYLERCVAYKRYLGDLQVSLKGAIGLLPKDKQSIFKLIMDHLNKEVSAHDLSDEQAS